MGKIRYPIRNPHFKNMSDQRLCPLCEIPFMEIPIDAGTIEICEKCEGMFFEYDEMKAVLSDPAEGVFHEIAL